MFVFTTDLKAKHDSRKKKHIKFSFSHFGARIQIPIIGSISNLYTAFYGFALA